jgi:hypothetical protein
VQEKLASTSTALHSLDGAVDKQLHNIRTDVKQAILVASSSLRAELEAAAQARQQQDAAQHQAQLKGAHECAGLLVIWAMQHSLVTGSLCSCPLVLLQSGCHVAQPVSASNTQGHILLLSSPGLTSELDALVSSNQRSLVENLTEEIERRTAATLAASGASVRRAVLAGHGHVTTEWQRQCK